MPTHKGMEEYDVSGKQKNSEWLEYKVHDEE